MEGKHEIDLGHPSLESTLQVFLKAPLLTLSYKKGLPELNTKKKFLCQKRKKMRGDIPNFFRHAASVCGSIHVDTLVGQLGSV